MLQIPLANTPFKNFRHAISYYNHSAPARYQAPDFGREQSSSSKNNSKVCDFSGASPIDLWVSIAWAIGRSLSYYSHDHLFAWTARNIGDRIHQLSIEEIAQLLRVNERKVRKWLKDIDKDLIRELRRRELIPKAQQLSKLDFIAGWDARKEVEDVKEKLDPEDETLILVTDIDLERAWALYCDRQKQMMNED